ncbi:MAG: hypothetical protein WHT06_04320 [Desulfobacterales bacterium]
MDDRPCERLAAGGIELFIERRLLDALPPEGGILPVYMGDYGCWRMSVSGGPPGEP